MQARLQRLFGAVAFSVAALCGVLATGVQPANAYTYDTRFCYHHPRDPHCHPHHVCGRGRHLDRFGHCAPN